MTTSGPLHIGSAGRAALWVRRAKVAALSARRLADWRLTRHFPAPVFVPPVDFPALHGQHAVAIESEGSRTDPRLEAGKRRNLALAVPAFDGLELSPQRPLSFWRVLGRVAAAQGYVYGLELRGGCLVPALGGGICMLSNALFALAAQLGWTIVERHGHSLQAVPSPPGELWGLDATVFWPYVDLRAAPTQHVRLSARVADGTLLLSVHGARPLEHTYRLTLANDHITATRDADGNEVRMREAELRRQKLNVAGDAIGHPEIIARSRRRLLFAAQQRRNCLTCGRTDCHASPTLDPARLLSLDGGSHGKR